jgi:uncharacterized protein (TIGR03067 family)
MKRIALVTLFLALAHGFMVRGDDTAEKRRLEGSWRIVEDHFNGVRMQGDEADVGQIVLFEGSTVILPNRETGKPEKLKYTLNTKERPKHISWFYEVGGEALSMRGVYSLQGDRLTICLAVDDERPTKLETRKGDHQVMVVLRRIRVTK